MHMFLVLKMADDRRVMYDGFGKKNGQNGLEWLRNSLIKLLLMVFVLQSTPAEFVGDMGF
jgi:hypothetical protein